MNHVVHDWKYIVKIQWVLIWLISVRSRLIITHFLWENKVQERIRFINLKFARLRTAAHGNVSLFHSEIGDKFKL